MAIPKTAPSNPSRDLKQRVNVCLNKLADRDTLAVAAVELDSIARDLTPDSFSPFLSCIYSTGDADPSAVRRHSLRLFALLSHSHGDALSPYLSKMLSAVVRRFRDPDSSVRSACVDAVSAMSSKITRPPFSAFLRPLSEAVTQEQDHNAQIGSAMCLAAAVDASPEPDAAQLMKLVPRLMKLVKSEGFKAKPALILLIGSIVGAGGASNRNVLDCLIPSLVEHLSSEDWAARKAAAEALGRLAAVERDLVVNSRSKCLAALEIRRFDKVKGVREIMNRTLELWKDIPDVEVEALSPPQSKSSTKDNGSDPITPDNKSSHGLSNSASHQGTATSRARSSVLDNNHSATMVPPLKSSEKKSGTSLFQKLDCKRSSDWKLEATLPNSPSSNMTHEDDLNTSFKVLDSYEKRIRSIRPETKRALFRKMPDETGHKFGNSRLGSRVVPYHEGDNSDTPIPESSLAEEASESHKDAEDLILIRKQLVQIESQQSSLLDLLQRFIGHSQDGMNCLETRVHGLERALDEISYDLALSSGRLANTDCSGNTCCKLPGAEFLSSKFWRRSEARFSTSTGGLQKVVRCMPDKYANIESSKPVGQMFQDDNAAGSAVNPAIVACSKPRVKPDMNVNGSENTMQVGERTPARCGALLNASRRTTRMNIHNCSSA